jgi:IS5 family transposase
MVRQTRRVVQALCQPTAAEAQGLLSEAEQALPLVTQVIEQTRSRVLEGKKVASEQKVLSLFEPHTRAIPRHKGGALVEFGRQVILDEVEGGVVTRYEILEHPNEHGQAVEAVRHHRKVFGHPPHLVAGDRGVHAAETVENLQAAGVKQVAIPAICASSRRNARRWNTREPSGAAIAGGQASRAALPVSDAITVGARVPITDKRGWSGGWAWESLPVISGILPKRREHKAQREENPATSY